VVIENVLTREAVHEVRAGHEEMGGLVPYLGLIGSQPSELGANGLTRQRRATTGEYLFGTQKCGQLLDLARRPGVDAIENPRAEGISVFIGCKHARSKSAATNARDFSIRLGHELVAKGAEVFPPNSLRVLLNPAWMRP